ncbi:16S rRNA (adenine(1518)-N(6)/adenine(1519)-N(6))-dimethyltransferase RsmA [Clostridium polynesiense]|uniref:16S rRNA (adenine(1518)-N(6)/adenine(1519)-N(6))- dimethyltransferase RsmA n=1 Tax=Clostridium polynesiense TaxID=1325933 RepID=UPI000590BE11|nr:16S rRNA (adenine(1518)-N(6)/adenine(1519)-N(6))-dimethyltransferase RsmA [Clostridium polynesiense]
MDITTLDLVKKYNFKFSKSLGQNFLVEDSVLRDIVAGAEVSAEDHVIEIGPGVGTLTRELLKRAKKVTAIELDSDLISILTKELGDNEKFTLIHKDALKVDFNDIIEDGESVKLVANLPYYVTTPIITGLLNKGYNFKSLTIMIQKEVAERINAEPRTKEYGALTLLVQYHCSTEIIRKVSPNCFIPRPKVDSIVIRLDKLPEPRVQVEDEKLFFRVIRESFNMRRKTLSNALKALKLPKETLDKAFEESDIDSRRRGETLSIEEFAALANSIYKLVQK